MKIDESNLTNNIKICILEDDKEYRESLKKILLKEERIRLYGEFDNVHDCLKTFQSPFKPDVCLIDIVLKGEQSGIDCARIINKNWPHVHLIIMTSFPDARYLAESKELEADFIEKGTRGEVIIDKIVTSSKLTQRELFISLSNEKSDLDPINLIQQIQNAQQQISTLSDYQRKVLKFKLEGKSVSETATQLQMNPRTVRTHLRRALQKLDLPDLLKYIKL
ncbi:MAG TPA: response regulator transcription factor [Spirochaetes bacterium]|nr:response regulator transcription factor [Spirochaetota bacterium]